MDAVAAAVCGVGNRNLEYNLDSVVHDTGLAKKPAAAAKKLGLRAADWAGAGRLCVATACFVAVTARFFASLDGALGFRS